MAAQRHRVAAIRNHHRLFYPNTGMVSWGWALGHRAVQAGECQNCEQYFHGLIHLGESPSRALLRVAKYMTEWDAGVGRVVDK